MESIEEMVEVYRCNAEMEADRAIVEVLAGATLTPTSVLTHPPRPRKKKRRGV